MSARSCRRPFAATAGFTLLELLVVIGLLAVLLAVVMPAGLRMLDAHSERVALSQTVREVAQLGTRAAEAGQFIVIGSDEEPPFAGPLLAPVVRHEPSDGWVVTPVEEPIWFFPDGTCSGGSVRVERGETRERFEFTPPLCEAERWDL